MDPKEEFGNPQEITSSFYERPRVKVDTIPIGAGIPFGIEIVSNPALGIGGAYGSWGEAYDNDTLPKFIEQRLGARLSDEERIDLAAVGFNYRHHLANLTDEEHLELELQVGERYLRGAIQACGWEPHEVEAVLIGMSGPVSEDYTVQIARRAGIPESALKASIHKACDSSMGGLHMVLNPDLPYNQRTGRNLARELQGKKVLVGGIEGLSRFLERSHDLNALQLFGNGAGVIGVIPGETMQFLAGKTQEVYDEKGLLAVHMYYPHSRQEQRDGSLVEVSEYQPNAFRLSGLMHEPEDGQPVEMAGMMGMVKLFVRSGVEVVQDVYQNYKNLMRELGELEKNIRVTVAHHANFKINKLKAIQLSKEGISLTMPWVLSDFGNVSAASNMIAFLRQLPDLLPDDHILFDGFGAGTYYDVFAVALGKRKLSSQRTTG